MSLYGWSVFVRLECLCSFEVSWSVFGYLRVPTSHMKRRRQDASSQVRTNVLGLPDEIWRFIVKGTDNSTLSHLSSACHDLHAALHTSVPTWWSEENWIMHVREIPTALLYARVQTPAMCLAAVQQNGLSLEYVRKQTPEVCLAAVQQDGDALQFVREQTPKLCLAAVQQTGFALTYVKEKTPEICLAAVQKDGWALYYVPEQTPELCLAAVQQNAWALKVVQVRTPELCLAAITLDPRTICLTGNFIV